MRKEYKQAPLPFQGQKRNYVKLFKEKLKEFPEDAIYIDLFGGSGLLSHTVKNVYPNAKVIYNDFDNYQERLANVDNTNAILQDLRQILKGLPKEKRLSPEQKIKVVNRLKNESGYIDWITLSGSVLFSMNYVFSIKDLEKETLYNNVKKSDYTVTGYLDGLSITQVDYKELYNRYKSKNNIVFLVDPPYLSTDSGTYKNYWKLKDYLDVLDVLMDHRFFYFTSHKSHVLELCNWFSSRTSYKNPFSDSQIFSIHSPVSRSSSYFDQMIYRK